MMESPMRAIRRPWKQRGQLLLNTIHMGQVGF